MTFTLFIHNTIGYSIIITGILFCLIPVTKHLKFPLRKIIPILTVSFLFFCPAVGAISAIKNMPPNSLFFPIMFSCLFLYFRTVNLEKSKLLYLFLCAVAMLSFGGTAADITDAVYYSGEIPDKMITIGLFVQYLISFLVLCLFFIIRNKTIWLLENFHSENVWFLVCIIPTIIAFCNIMMLPEDYAVVSVGRIFSIYLVIDISLFLLFLISQIMFYYVAKTATEKQVAEQRILLYQMQTTQYESLYEYIEQTRRIRHDFRHVMITVGKLISAKQYDSLEQYYNEYLLSCAASNVPQYFCSNTSLNALLSYYGNMAADCEIKTHFQIQLPDTKKISDVDYGILFGNLLENAIYACKTTPLPDRYIHLISDIDTPGSFYITMANSFDGIVRERNGHFFSTKRNGSATGLVSIRAVAEKYDGTANFYYKKREFISNIMMKV